MNATLILAIALSIVTAFALGRLLLRVRFNSPGGQVIVYGAMLGWGTSAVGAWIAWVLS